MARVARVRDDLVRFLQLLDQNPESEHWSWMDKRPIPAKDANKFLLQCMIDFRWRTEIATERAAKFAETELGDPDYLWEVLSNIPLDEWAARHGSQSLHCTSARHMKVRSMAILLCQRYHGDATEIWRDRTPQETLNRLEDLGLGPQVSRMTVGALIDEDQVQGSCDVKPDLHLKRVLGRVFEGRPLSESDVIAVTRTLFPTNPWIADWPVWRIGKVYCHASTPNCADCPLRSSCAFYQGQRPD